MSDVGPNQAPPAPVKKRGPLFQNRAGFARTEGPDGTVGRPRAVIDINQLRALAQIHCTVQEAAGVLGVSFNTLRNRLERGGPARRAWEEGRAHGAASLRRKQFAVAMGEGQGEQIGTNPDGTPIFARPKPDAGLLKWLGIQVLGQRHHVDVHTPDPVEHNVSGRVEIGIEVRRAAEDYARLIQGG
jgi:hypothetical protein